jgi:hypothetical protein
LLWVARDTETGDDTALDRLLDKGRTKWSGMLRSDYIRNLVGYVPDEPKKRHWRPNLLLVQQHLTWKLDDHDRHLRVFAIQFRHGP